MFDLHLYLNNPYPGNHLVGEDSVSAMSVHTTH